MTRAEHAQYGVLLHTRWTEDEEPRATVIHSDDGYTWHAIADACPDYAEEVAVALQWCANARAAEADAEQARISAEIADGEEPTWPLEHSTVRLRSVHDASVCAGQPCTIHNRSDHHMRAMPQRWRQDRGIMERVCPHGVGHPDPDSPWPDDSEQWTHGCDGCCTP